MLYSNESTIHPLLKQAGITIIVLTTITLSTIGFCIGYYANDIQNARLNVIATREADAICDHHRFVVTYDTLDDTKPHVSCQTSKTHSYLIVVPRLPPLLHI
jgi:hypothetical protein